MDVARGPNRFWASGLSYLVRRESTIIRMFFEKTEHLFRTELQNLSDAFDENNFGEEHVLDFVDERDEIERFVENNHYLAVVQAYSLFERTSVRLLEVAAKYDLVARASVFAKSGRFIVPGKVEPAFRALGVSLSPSLKDRIHLIRRQRNLIVHNGGRIPKNDSVKTPLKSSSWNSPKTKCSPSSRMPKRAP